MIGPATTRIMLAVLTVYERDGRATVRSVAECADRSLAVTFRHLVELRAHELVSWESGARGTLRPLVAAHEPRSAAA